MVRARMAKAKPRLVLVALIIVVAAALLAIKFWPTTPHGGLSEADAIQVATMHANPGATGVIAAEVRHNFHTGFDLPIHDQAWVVTFAGQWPLLCFGGCEATTQWVAIDYYTGEWIASQYSYRKR
jgi:hypothetical protein